MDIKLRSPGPAVNMLDTHTTEHETTLALRCHDAAFKSCTIEDEEHNALFRIVGASFGKSWSWRRKVYDAKTNAHLFDFRHENLDIKNRWVVEDPAGNKIGSLVHDTQISSNHSAVNATLRNSAGEDVRIAMRPEDAAATTTTLSIDGKPFAFLRKVADNLRRVGGYEDKTIWELRIASAVDLSIIVVLALCRAEMGHVWQQ
ncbi:hypothetical protein GGS21DRAFT_119744 [Xylaria nigripes]|nr:hypothetical protein GGS21DRAFT_119744 [Xylaria nigripes]